MTNPYHTAAAVRWRELGYKFSRWSEGEDDYMPDWDHSFWPGYHGICAALSRRRELGAAGYWAYRDDVDALDLFRPTPDADGYWWDQTPEGHGQRALACYLLADMVEAGDL